MHTVKEMLVLLLVVEVAAVLDDIVDLELGRVDLLGTEVVVLESATNLAVLLAIGLGPESLNVSTLEDVVPVGVGSAVGLLGLGAYDLLLKSRDSLGGKRGNLIPDSLGLTSELAKELLKRLSP